MQKIINEIESLTREKGFIYSLALIVYQDTFFDAEEAADIDWSSRLTFQELSFLIGLTIKSSIKVELIGEEEVQSHIEKVYRLFQKLHNSYMKSMPETFSRVENDKSICDDMELSQKAIFHTKDAMAESIFYGDSGAYDFQFNNFSKLRYQQDLEWIKTNKGFEVETACNVFKELKKQTIERNLKRTKTKDFECFIKETLSIFCFTFEDLNQYPKEEVSRIFKAFSCEPGDVNKSLNCPGEYNVFNSHPIIKLDVNSYFIPIKFNLSQSLYESPFYWMVDDKKYKDTSLKNRGVATVDIACNLLKHVFGEDKVYKEVKIFKNKKEIVTDIDLLVVTGNKVLVFQIKSKKLTALSREGDLEQLQNDFNGAIQDAYQQALVSRKHLLEKDSKLMTSSGAEVDLDDEINEVYMLCVTSDHYPAVGHQTRTLLNKQVDDPYPIAISLFDLDILLYYLPDPFEFLYYIRQRVNLYENFIGQSEMDYLGYHLNQKLFIGKDEETGEKIDCALIQGMAQLIDAHYPAVHGEIPETKAMEKLHTKWSNSEFQKMIGYLKRAKNPGFTDAVFFLYDLSGKGADDFILTVKSTRQRCLEENKSLRFCMLYGDRGVSYVCDYSNGSSLIKNVMEYSQIKKYQLKAKSWLCAGGIATKDNLFDTVVYSNEPWNEDPLLEELSSKLYVNSKPISLKSGFKVGRNDPCPCGSKIKFKKCHGK